MVVGIGKQIVPLIQAVLSVHHVPGIQEILDRWLQHGAKVPKEITTDGSLALQNAVCLSFNKMTFKQYNIQCFDILSLMKKIMIFLPAITDMIYSTFFESCRNLEVHEKNE